MTFRHDITCNASGDSHHASRDHGVDFYTFNYITAAALTILEHKEVKRIIVVDLDEHQHGSTVNIFTLTPEAFTFSMHIEKNLRYARLPPT